MSIQTWSRRFSGARLRPLGRVPLRQLGDRAIIRRKLEFGTYAALAGDERLPPIIGDLVRGMLAEDPEHPPTPAMLLDPTGLDPEVSAPTWAAVCHELGFRLLPLPQKSVQKESLS